MKSLNLLFLSIHGLHAQSLDTPLITVEETEIDYVEVDEVHFTLGIKTHDKEIDIARIKKFQPRSSIFWNQKKYLKSISKPSA